jgi:flagellar biosynthesis protein FliQ
MKGKIVLGSILAVLVIALVPATTAIEYQTLQPPSTTMISYQELRQMSPQEIISFLQDLTSDYPEVAQHFETAVHDLENTPITTDQTKSLILEKNQQPRKNDENQTLLEKIFWKIYNYRVLRLLISLLLFLQFQSKFTLLRTTTWGIRLLRWVKLGILLGYIDPTQKPTQTPDIGFAQDSTNHTLSVISMSAADILWSDISEVGEGSCDPLPTGNVTIGNMITNCTGIIILLYLPTYEVIDAFEFP